MHLLSAPTGVYMTTHSAALYLIPTGLGTDPEGVRGHRAAFVPECWEVGLQSVGLSRGAGSRHGRRTLGMDGRWRSHKVHMIEPMNIHGADTYSYFIWLV